MSSELRDKLSSLVDILRAKPDESLAISDVAMVTEALISTMQRYFSSINTQIYCEFRELSSYIEGAKSEINQLLPDELQQDKLPRAGMELDAIVKATEEATDIIMQSAEELMSIESSDVEEVKSQIVDKCMAIFEACSFQDITGQRISKVVDTLTHIEDRLDQLQKSFWGEGEASEKLSPEDMPVAQDKSATSKGSDDVSIDNIDDNDLLNGPALDGEGIDQSYVDSVDFDQISQ